MTFDNGVYMTHLRETFRLASISFVQYFHQNKIDKSNFHRKWYFWPPHWMFSCKKNSILFWPSDTQTHYLWSQLRHFTLPLPLSRLTLEWISLLLQTASQYPQIFCPKGWHWQVIVTKYSLFTRHLYICILKFSS